jgi:hypothetical protein
MYLIAKIKRINDKLEIKKALHQKWGAFSMLSWLSYAPNWKRSNDFTTKSESTDLRKADTVIELSFT